MFQPSISKEKGSSSDEEELDKSDELVSVNVLGSFESESLESESEDELSDCFEATSTFLTKTFSSTCGLTIGTSF